MFETAIGDGSKKLWLQEEIAETGRMNTDITALLVWVAARYGQVALLGLSISCGSSSWRRGLGLKLLVGVIDEIFFGRHGGDVW